mmetsp:Transcript_23117/g.34811  ORF Transcript_23117/g.34811 Transcript_23117/m.34811 type:complete len:212 (-) Transcript_23117:32-667(-)
MERNAVHTAQVTMVVSDDHVLLQIPALDFAIFGAREEIRVPVRNGQPSNSADVSGKRQFERTARKIPNFDEAVVARGCEPLVGWIACHCSNPTFVARQDSHQLPRCMPLRLRNFVSLHPRSNLHFRAGVLCSRSLERNDGPDRPLQPSGRGTIAAARDVRQHLSDGIGFRLPSSVVRNSRGGQERLQCHGICGLLWHVSDVFVLVVHLHAE